MSGAGRRRGAAGGATGPVEPKTPQRAAEAEQWARLGSLLLPLLRVGARVTTEADGSIASDCGAALLGLVVALSRHDRDHLRAMARAALGEPNPPRGRR